MFQPEISEKFYQKYNIYANISSHVSTQLMIFAPIFVSTHVHKICIKNYVKWSEIDKVMVVKCVKFQENWVKYRYYCKIYHHNHHFKSQMTHNIFNQLTHIKFAPKIV